MTLDGEAGTSASGGRVASFLATARIYGSWRMCVIFVMGFVSGLPLALTTSTLSTWLTEAGVSLTAVGLFALAGTPYNLKFLWAPLLDAVPLPLLSSWLGRRRAWMLIIQVFLLASIGCLGISSPATMPLLAGTMALSVAFFSASQDIVIDAYRIEILDPDLQGAGAAMSQTGYRIGLLVSGAGALFLAEVLDWRLVYLAMGALVVVGMIAALLAPVPQEPAPEANPPRRQRAMALRLKTTIVDPFSEFFTREGVVIAVVILGFILLYKMGDAFAGVMANPFYIRIGFSKSEIASVTKIFGLVSTLGGVFIGGLMVKRLGVLRSLLWCGILQMLSNLMFAAQAEIGPVVSFLYLTVAVENLSGGMGSAAFVAYLSLLCNTRYTGTQYALLTSFMAFGRTWLSASSGWFADQTDWVTFFVFSTVIAVPGLLLLVWMMKKLPMERQHGARS